jgi:hypothetical protein
MLFYEFAAGGTDYKLRLNTRNIITLEKLLGCSPLAIFGDGETMPKTTDMVNILFCSLQQYQHGITLDSAFDIFDKYLEDGNTVSDFLQVIIGVYKVSGLIKESTESKN